MIPAQSQLEREIASLKDRLNVAVEASRNAKALLVAWVSGERQKEGSFQRLFALVDAVAKESAMAAPLLTRLGWGAGMKEARELALQVSKMEEGPWHTACLRVVQEIEKKAGLS
jgi:hypothetical protein